MAVSSEARSSSDVCAASEAIEPATWNSRRSDAILCRVECRCATIDVLHGDDARRYADEHLNRLEEDRGAWLYQCPAMGADWIMDIPRYWDTGHGGRSRLRRVKFAVRSPEQLWDRVERIERELTEAGHPDWARRIYDAKTISGHPGEVYPETRDALLALQSEGPLGPAIEYSVVASLGFLDELPNQCTNGLVGQIISGVRRTLRRRDRRRLS